MRPRRPAVRLPLCLLPLMIGSCTAAPAGRPSTAAAPPPAPAIPVSAAPAETALSLHLEGTARQGGLLAGQIGGATGIGPIRLTLDGKPVPVAPDGRFIIGFGRDAPPAATLRAIAANGAIREQTIPVVPRAWDIQSLPTLPRGTTPTPEFLARRKLELARINAARAITSDSQGWRQHFVWPVTGRISGVFGSQRIYAGEPGDPHGGVDVARPTGTMVVAPADGIVILAAPAPFTLEGNLLMIDHGMGLNSAFLHLSRIDVRVGEAVRQGQPIGAVGMTGRATGPHLHWGLKWQDARIDPATLAGAMQILRK